MIVVAISGASGPIMGIRLIEELLNLKERVAAVVYSRPAGSSNMKYCWRKRLFHL
jgi:3-polyprenyl-4-hydroxybenzoate decarboxylase